MNAILLVVSVVVMVLWIIGLCWLSAFHAGREREEKKRRWTPWGTL